jgi:hypothetical protein
MHIFTVIHPWETIPVRKEFMLGLARMDEIRIPYHKLFLRQIFLESIYL